MMAFDWQRMHGRFNGILELLSDEIEGCYRERENFFEYCRSYGLSYNHVDDLSPYYNLQCFEGPKGFQRKLCVLQFALRQQEYFLFLAVLYVLSSEELLRLMFCVFRLRGGRDLVDSLLDHLEGENKETFVAHVKARVVATFNNMLLIPSVDFKSRMEETLEPFVLFFCRMSNVSKYKRMLSAAEVRFHAQVNPLLRQLVHQEM